jgi:hypothetical protein
MLGERLKDAGPIPATSTDGRTDGRTTTGRTDTTTDSTLSFQLVKVLIGDQVLALGRVTRAHSLSPLLGSRQCLKTHDEYTEPELGGVEGKHFGLPPER